MSPMPTAAGRPADGPRPAPPAPMLDVHGFAEMLDVSVRSVRRLVDAGKCPPPVRLGRLCRWPRHVVEAWLADGCPSNCRRRQGGAR
jgi:predicted DNA-binding transcriptional regulator AlpA